MTFTLKPITTGLLMAGLCSPAFAATTHVKLNTAIQGGQTSEATFSKLSAAAIDRGLRDATLLGKVKKDDGGLTVTWDAITKTVEGTEVATELDSPLLSTLSKPAKAGEEIIVEGDLDQLLQEFDSMVNDATEEETIGGEDEDSTGYFAQGDTGSADYDSASDDFDVETDDYLVTYQACDLRLDFETLVATEQDKMVKTSASSGEILEEGECADTDITHNIEQDYEIEQCVDLSDYESGHYYQGFKHFVSRSLDGSEKEYVSGCENDMQNPKTIMPEVAECEATENLTTNTATINKKWYFEEGGQKEYVSECMASDETYPIVETELTCEPFVNDQTNDVITQTRKGWQDGQQAWHYITECRPSEDSTEVPLEKEFSGELEHDWSNGASYEMSRDYYMHDGEKVYINEEYSRDPSLSYPHKTSMEGCPTTHDDENLRSQLHEKIVIERNGQIEDIRECEAGSSYVSYTPNGIQTTPNNFFEGTNKLGGTSGSRSSDISAKQACDTIVTRYANYNPRFDVARGSNGFMVEYGCNSNGVMCQNGLGSYTTFFNESTTYRRFDESIYIASSVDVCESTQF